MKPPLARSDSDRGELLVSMFVAVFFFVFENGPTSCSSRERVAAASMASPVSAKETDEEQETCEDEEQGGREMRHREQTKNSDMP